MCRTHPRASLHCSDLSLDALIILAVRVELTWRNPNDSERLHLWIHLIRVWTRFPRQTCVGQGTDRSVPVLMTTRISWAIETVRGATWTFLVSHRGLQPLFVSYHTLPLVANGHQSVAHIRAVTRLGCHTEHADQEEIHPQIAPLPSPGLKFVSNSFICYFVSSSFVHVSSETCVLALRSYRGGPKKRSWNAIEALTASQKVRYSQL